MSEVTVNGRLQVRRDTTEHWDNAQNCVPLEGEVIVYTDHIDLGEGESPRYIPGVKIGTGNAYVQHLPFVDDDLRERVLQHCADVAIHVTSAEKTFWNNKLNWSGSVEDDVLVLNRN